MMDALLRKKIIQLFEYRELPSLISYKNDVWNEDFYEKLIQLQYDIYLLDHELETNWAVDMEVISNRWDKIYEDLLALNIGRHKHDNYCAHIFKYQRHELELRKQKLPTRLSMEYFYFYKSCDVKLLRRIIYDNNPALKRVISPGQWRLFDLVTEINDDVEDLQEDALTINGNRFLISCLQFGPERTANIFIGYLEELLSRNESNHFNKIDGVELQEWTKEQIIATKELVKTQVKEFTRLDLRLYQKHLEMEPTNG